MTWASIALPEVDSTYDEMAHALDQQRFWNLLSLKLKPTESVCPPRHHVLDVDGQVAPWPVQPRPPAGEEAGQLAFLVPRQKGNP